MSRSMYIAAITIAPAPIAAHHQCELEGAREDEELTREVRRARHGERDHAERHEQRREHRPAARHPAEQRELAGRRPPLDDAREEEERDRDEAVRDHLQDGAVEAERRPGEQADRDQARLRERRVRDDAAEVGRAEREQRAVDERRPPRARGSPSGRSDVGSGKSGIAMRSIP